MSWEGNRGEGRATCGDFEKVLPLPHLLHILGTEPLHRPEGVKVPRVQVRGRVRDIVRVGVRDRFRLVRAMISYG